MMNRRSGVIAALAAVIGFLRYEVRAQEPQSSGKMKDNIYLSPQTHSTYLSIDLGNLRYDKAIQVTYKGETISLTSEEIMEALRPPKKA